MSKFAACLEELEKTALFERLVRLGATSIPGTPQLLMKHRSPGELRALQGAVETGWNKRVTAPLMGAMEGPLNRLPKGKIQSGARWVAQSLAEDPVGMSLAKAVPIPGASVLYAGAKKGLEKVIDRVAPLRG
jgi:hypothetical protein